MENLRTHTVVLTYTSRYKKRGVLQDMAGSKSGAGDTQDGSGVSFISDNTEAIRDHWVVYRKLGSNLEKLPQAKHRAIQASNQDHN